MERKRRGCSEKLIVTGENMKKPPDWKTFLANEENKKQSGTDVSEIGWQIFQIVKSHIAILYH
jgi:hypothetical protein